MKSPISDLHVHSGLKGYASQGYPESEGMTIWNYFAEKTAEKNKLSGVIRSAIRELAKDSQANLDVCAEAGLRAPFLSIYPVERQMFAVSPRYPFRTIFKLFLPEKDYPYLGAAVSGFPLERVRSILDKNVRDGQNDGVDYYREFQAERDYLLSQTATRSEKPELAECRFRIADSYEAFQTYTADENIITSILTTEGAHSFGHYLYHTTFGKTFENLEAEERRILTESFLRNIREVKTREEGKYAPFFVTFCHHFNNLLAGHARSFSDRSDLFGFIPWPNKPGMRYLFNQEPNLNQGFSTLGQKVLELFLEKGEGKGRRILIDSKHMSIETRRQFYQIIRRRRLQANDPIPIVHSHGAVSGWETLAEAQRHPETEGIDKGKFFSRWQINLTDEDLLETFDSDGLIGLVLHEGRMPGDDFKKKAKRLKRKIKRARSGSQREQNYQQQLKDLYLKLIWGNIFHIVKVIREKRSRNGWKMIALGSDFDGLIDPFNSYTTVGHYTDLRTDLQDYLLAGKEICYADRGRAIPLSEDQIAVLLGGKDPEALLADIFFHNADRFLANYFTPEYLLEKESAEQEQSAV